MTGRGWFLTLALALVMLTGSGSVKAQNYNALKECIELSPNIDDIHVCMDNYLDLLDASLNDMNDFLLSSLTGEARAGLISSHRAFVEYRRENCLWYLNFSTPREEAEQIAKNCLSNMSQQRLRELQTLLTAGAGDGQVYTGYYVFGAERNSFQPCGTDKRYWLEGDSTQLGRAQQSYLSVATSDLQVLHATWVGRVDDEAQAPAGHDGIFKLDALVELRVPTDEDCQLPASNAGKVPGVTAPAAEVSTVGDLPAGDVPAAQDEPLEQLIAYFGAWIVDCTDVNGIRACQLKVDMNGGAGAPPATLMATRQKQRETSLEVVFAEREIDSPARIRWQVDAMRFGDIVSSEIRVDESGTRQLIPASRFLRDELLPMMIGGSQLNLEVLVSVDDNSGENYTGTLNGLTKAISFADDFVRDDAP